MYISQRPYDRDLITQPSLTFSLSLSHPTCSISILLLFNLTKQIHTTKTLFKLNFCRNPKSKSYSNSWHALSLDSSFQIVLYSCLEASERVVKNSCLKYMTLSSVFYKQTELIEDYGW